MCLSHTVRFALSHSGFQIGILFTAIIIRNNPSGKSNMQFLYTLCEPGTSQSDSKMVIKFCSSFHIYFIRAGPSEELIFIALLSLWFSMKHIF